MSIVQHLSAFVQALVAAIFKNMYVYSIAMTRSRNTDCVRKRNEYKPAKQKEQEVPLFVAVDCDTGAGITQVVGG